MMVRKRGADHDEAGQEKNIESTDNKENKDIQEMKEPEKAEEAKSDEAGSRQAGSDEADAAAADKVIPKENNFEEKLAEMQDKYLRLSAEFDNYRKRTLREKIELSKYAGEELILRILPVMDDFERAISHSENSPECSAMNEGINLIYQKFSDFLKQSGVREIESLGVPFNVDVHDAVAKIKVEEEDKKGKIADVILKGYYLQDKVIRHAKVVVGE